MVTLSSFENLPLEIIRNIASFCSNVSVIFDLPLVSSRLYDACDDRELHRKIFQRELRQLVLSCQDSHVEPLTQPVSMLGQDWTESFSLKADALINSGSYQSSPSGRQYWTRWILALRLIQDTTGTWDISNFWNFLGLMQYMPHIFLLGVPLPYTQEKEKWLIELMAFYFLDVTGPPAFRSRYYPHGLDKDEFNLRMGLCLTVFALQPENQAHLFSKAEILCDQSIASWLICAILGSRNYLWASTSFDPPTRHSINAQVDTLATIMGMVARRDAHEFVGIIFPRPQKLPLFSNPDMSKYPLPFDLPPNLKEVESKSPERSLINVVKTQQKEFLDANSISQGSWCGCYLIDGFYDVETFRFSPFLRDIQFHSTNVGPNKWELVSNNFNDTPGASKFSGFLEGDENFCYISLIRDFINSTEPAQHWRAQLSPFGLLGGYMFHLPSGKKLAGGLFWLWKEAWANLHSTSITDTTTNNIVQ